VIARLNALTAGVTTEIKEQLRYRELLYQMTIRDLLIRYKQAVMGFAWALIVPVAQTLVFSVIFTRVAQIETDVPYPLYAMSGLLPWTFFASALRFSLTSLTNNSALVTKVYFPREIFPVSAVLVALVDFAVASLVLVGMMIYYGVPPSGAIWLLPVVLVVHVVFTLALALLLSMANLFYRDVKYMIDLVLMFWMFATSVVYPVERLGGRLAEVLAFNPMTPIIEGYRATILFGDNPFSTRFLVTAAASLVMLAGAWTLFHRAEARFAEVL
jgi:ABC-type polysaccharide/polyol phosphate export permease